MTGNHWTGGREATESERFLPGSELRAAQPRPGVTQVLGTSPGATPRERRSEGPAAVRGETGPVEPDPEPQDLAPRSTERPGDSAGPARPHGGHPVPWVSAGHPGAPRQAGGTGTGGPMRPCAREEGDPRSTDAAVARSCTRAWELGGWKLWKASPAPRAVALGLRLPALPPATSGKGRSLCTRKAASSPGAPRRQCRARGAGEEDPGQGSKTLAAFPTQ